MVEVAHNFGSESTASLPDEIGKVDAGTAAGCAQSGSALESQSYPVVGTSKIQGECCGYRLNSLCCVEYHTLIFIGIFACGLYPLISKSSAFQPSILPP